MNRRIYYYNNNKEKELLLAKKYYYINKDKILQNKRLSYLKNKQNKIAKVIEYQKIKYKTDLNFKLKQNLKSRIYKAIKGINKNKNTIGLLGIDIKGLWKHLEYKFQKGMTKKNHGKWHIDHIIPCASFDLTDTKQQEKCFHYTNLQPLWAFDNLSKNKY